MDGRDDEPPHRGPPAPLRAGQWSGPELHDLGGGAFTAAFSLSVAAAAVEWTQDPDALDWRPCVALGANGRSAGRSDGRWRLDSADGAHRCGPGGGLARIGLRYRPDPEAPWSAVSEERSSLEIPPARRPFPPVLLLAPALAGTGRVGTEVRVAPGRWAGLPAPALGLQWCRDGAAIPGATAVAYVPGAADDRTALTCRVEARSSAGTAVAVTAALAVRYPPPARAAPPFDEPFEEIFDQGSGVQEVPAAVYFTGPALRYAVSGAGAEIDAAGVVHIPTDAPLAEEVTVTATNSGGAVSGGFMVTVEPAEELWLAADRKGEKPKREPAPPAAAPATTGGWQVLPALGKAEVQAFVKHGVLSGDNGQYMLGAAQSGAEPDRIYTCQDSGGVWVSLDHGNSWNNLRNRGLYARFTTGIAVDPLDCRRVFVLTQGGGRDAGKFIGLQRSLDGGLNWERVIPNDVSPGRTTQSPINFAPTSADAGLGYATRWYCIIQKDSRRRNNGHPPEFYMSDDGGGGWRRVRVLDGAGFGSITHLVVSPTDPAVVYVNSEKGLWRFEAADQPDGAVTRLSGANGLPDGGVRDRLYLSPDGRTLIAGAAGQGIYRSTDAGARWSQIHADPELGKLHVNPWDPERMIVSYMKKGQQLKVSTDGGPLLRQARKRQHRAGRRRQRGDRRGDLPRGLASREAGADLGAWRPQALAVRRRRADLAAGQRLFQRQAAPELVHRPDVRPRGSRPLRLFHDRLRGGALRQRRALVRPRADGDEKARPHPQHGQRRGAAPRPGPADHPRLGRQDERRQAGAEPGRWRDLEGGERRRGEAAVCRLRPRRPAPCLPVARALRGSRRDLVGDDGAAEGLRGLGDDADREGHGPGPGGLRHRPRPGRRQQPDPALARPGRELGPLRRQPLRLRRRRHDRRRPLPGAPVRPGRLLHQGAERLDDPQVDGRARSPATSISTSWAASRAGCRRTACSRRWRWRSTGGIRK